MGLRIRQRRPRLIDRESGEFGQRSRVQRVGFGKPAGRLAWTQRLLEEQLEDLLEGSDLDSFRGRAEQLQKAGVPAELARRVAAMPRQPAAFDVVTVAADGVSVTVVAAVFDAWVTVTVAESVALLYCVALDASGA